MSREEIRAELLESHQLAHDRWLNDGHHKAGVNPVKLYGEKCHCNSCCAIRKGTYNTVWYYYGYQPAFCRVVEEMFKEDFPSETLSKLYNIWKNGVDMGRYCEATKGAEGS